MWRLKPRESSQKGREVELRKVRKNTPYRIKNPNRHGSSRKITIQLKPVWIDNCNVKVSVWDYDFEVGTIVCPMDWYGINEAFFKLIDRVLEDYPNSYEYDLVQKRKAESKNQITKKTNTITHKTTN
jgi:hypothetical protein